MNLLIILYIILFLFALVYLYHKYNINKKIESYYKYIPAPVVSEFQNYDWFVPSNPNIGFAPAVHFTPPSRKECLKWINQNFNNPDEAYSKFIECLQNITSKVWIKNLPIQSPGVGGEEEFKY